MFKDEDEVCGETVGPAWLEHEDGRLESPRPGWYTRSEAAELAATHNVDLEEV